MQDRLNTLTKKLNPIMTTSEKRKLLAKDYENMISLAKTHQDFEREKEIPEIINALNRATDEDLEKFYAAYIEARLGVQGAAQLVKFFERSIRLK